MTLFIILTKIKIIFKKRKSEESVSFQDLRRPKVFYLYILT